MPNLAIVGVGPSNLGVIYGMAQAAREGRLIEASEIDIFDQFTFFGAGLAYNPDAADPHHLFNYRTRSINIPDHGDFFKFIQDEQGELLAKADEFFEKRLQEKLRLRPSDEEALRAHYEKIKASFRRRYSDFANPENYHSRFMFGIFANQLFEKAIAQLRASGVVINLHPATKVTDIKKDPQSGAAEIFVGDESKKFDRALIGIGYPFVQGDVESQKYIDKIWPVEEMRENLQKIIAQEMSRRAQVGDENKVIKIAIHGAALSAFDALKSIFVDGYLEYDEAGNPRFVTLQEGGYELHVDFVMRQNYMKKFPDTHKPDRNLLELQTVCLAQVMLVKMLEPTFSHPNKKEFLKFFLKHLGADSADIDKNLTAELFTLEGNEVERLRALSERFKLQFDKVDYEKVFDECVKNFPNVILKNILTKFYALPTQCRSKESAEVEDLFNLQSYICGYAEALPPQTVEELRAFAKAGLFSCTLIGDEASLREKEGKLVFTTADGKKIKYDAVINARGYETDLPNSDSLYSSLHRADFTPKESGNPRMRVSEAKCKKIVVVREGDVNMAFKTGIQIAAGFYRERPAAAPEGRSATKLAGAAVSASAYYTTS